MDTHAERNSSMARWATRAALGAMMIGSLLVAIMFGGSPAHAKIVADSTPEDVLASLNEDLLVQIKADAAKNDVQSLQAASSFGDPIQITLWDVAYLKGQSVTSAVDPIDEWIAPIFDQRGSAIVTVRVWRPAPGEKATWAGTSDESDLGLSISQLKPSSVLVEDGATGSWFALDGEQISAVNERTARQIPKPMTVAEAQPVLVRVYDEITASNSDSETSAGGLGPVSVTPERDGGQVLLLAGSGVLWADPVS